ncbi:unnamed protein product [Phytophthora fragariaefolia]|uniref:Unnamed protein product n=1 Tax=Phytophthora fragariaefolia TaxID=1490495 RepID=A0A9W7DD12_9STRA|nr:unnamed protein product [Phytophthora fragariaefolia]
MTTWASILESVWSAQHRETTRMNESKQLQTSGSRLQARLDHAMQQLAWLFAVARHMQLFLSPEFFQPLIDPSCSCVAYLKCGNAGVTLVKFGTQRTGQSNTVFQFGTQPHDQSTAPWASALDFNIMTVTTAQSTLQPRWLCR